MLSPRHQAYGSLSPGEHHSGKHSAQRAPSLPRPVCHWGECWFWSGPQLSWGRRWLKLAGEGPLLVCSAHARRDDQPPQGTGDGALHKTAPQCSAQGCSSACAGASRSSFLRHEPQMAQPAARLCSRAIRTLPSGAACLAIQATVRVVQGSGQPSPRNMPCVQAGCQLQLGLRWGQSFAPWPCLCFLPHPSPRCRVNNPTRRLRISPPTRTGTFWLVAARDSCPGCGH
jgi:hypothetical protein